MGIFNHKIILMKNGSLIGTANNGYGQLGLGHNDPVGNNIMNIDINGVKSVSCGYDYSIALRENGTLIAWGNDNDNIITNLPQSNNFYKISNSGGYHISAITNNYNLVSWGRDNIGQVSDTPT